MVRISYLWHYKNFYLSLCTQTAEKSWSEPFWRDGRYSYYFIVDLFVFCLTGKVVIVTGANAGIGFHVALELAKRCRIGLISWRIEEKNLCNFFYDYIWKFIRTSWKMKKKSLKYIFCHIHHTIYIVLASKKVNMILFVHPFWTSSWFDLIWFD